MSYDLLAEMRLIHRELANPDGKGSASRLALLEAAFRRVRLSMTPGEPGGQRALRMLALGFLELNIAITIREGVHPNPHRYYQALKEAGKQTKAATSWASANGDHLGRALGSRIGVSPGQVCAQRCFELATDALLGMDFDRAISELEIALHWDPGNADYQALHDDLRGVHPPMDFGGLPGRLDAANDPAKRLDLFISYNSRDSHLARHVAECLLAGGVKVWMGEYQVQLSNYQAFLEAIDDGLANCRYGLTLTSPEWCASKYCQYELAGLKHTLRHHTDRIIDVLSADTSVELVIEELRRRTDLDLSSLPVPPGPRNSQNGRLLMDLPRLSIGVEEGVVLHRGVRRDELPAEFAKLQLDVEGQGLPMNMENLRLDSHTRVLPNFADRRIYTLLRHWAKQYAARSGGEVRGLHLVWKDGRGHFALTICKGNRYLRKYAVIYTDPERVCWEVTVTFHADALVSILRLGQVMDGLIEDIRNPVAGERETIQYSMLSRVLKVTDTLRWVPIVALLGLVLYLCWRWIS